MMKQNEIAKGLGISKSYLSMILSGQRRIPEHLEKPISELVHKNPIQEVPSKQRVERSNRSRDARTPASNRSQKFTTDLLDKFLNSRATGTSSHPPLVPPEIMLGSVHLKVILRA